MLVLVSTHRSIAPAWNTMRECLGCETYAKYTHTICMRMFYVHAAVHGLPRIHTPLFDAWSLPAYADTHSGAITYGWTSLSLPRLMAQQWRIQRKDKPDFKGSFYYHLLNFKWNLNLFSQLILLLFWKFKDHLNCLLKCNQPPPQVRFKQLITPLKIPTLKSTWKPTSQPMLAQSWSQRCDTRGILHRKIDWNW